MEPMATAFPDFSLDLAGARTPQQAAGRVTHASASNLWAVGRALPARKRRLFEAAYATMRVVDDFVDDAFLALPADRRAALRPRADAAVRAWEAACVHALAGERPAGDAVDPIRAAGAGMLYDALAAAAGNGAPAPAPWHDLAEAMRHDVAETALVAESDFDRYCEGATVAPATVFLFVLTARESDGRLESPFDHRALHDKARPMARFCYLVHILRDLAADAARGGQIVTLPGDWLAAAGLTRDGVAAAAARRDPAARALADRLIHRAHREREAADAVEADLAPALDARERAILGALLAVYRDMHDRLAADPSAALAGDPSVVRGVRGAVLARFGLLE